jgi:hypothetical protein
MFINSLHQKKKLACASASDVALPPLIIYPKSDKKTEPHTCIYDTMDKTPIFFLVFLCTQYLHFEIKDNICTKHTKYFSIQSDGQYTHGCGAFKH